MRFPRRVSHLWLTVSIGALAACRVKKRKLERARVEVGREKEREGERELGKSGREGGREGEGKKLFPENPSERAHQKHRADAERTVRPLGAHSKARS